MSDPVMPIDDAMLLDYVKGRLDATTAAAVMTYLSLDAAAAARAERLREVRAVVEGDAAEPVPAATLARAKALFATRAATAPGAAPTLDRIRRAAADAVAATGGALERLAASLTFDSREETALAGFRAGGEDAGATPYHLTFASEVGEIDLEIEPPEGTSAARAAPWRVLGQFAAPAGELPTATATLIAEAGAGGAAEAEADEFGFFSLETRPGTYDLELTIHGEGVVVVIPELRIG